jgi:predicted glycoside hydrolase/deacetylase ChbG (UPF0249 family)
MIKLDVNADDFGMCGAVNEGVRRAFREGIVTQASIMVPTPGFLEAVRMATDEHLACGVHITLACEWDLMRWSPLTAHESLVGADGFMLPHTDCLRWRSPREAQLAEAIAQVERVQEAGIRPLYLDMHIRLHDQELMAALCKRYGLRTRERLRDHEEYVLGYNTVFQLSTVPPRNKKKRLLGFINSLKWGRHLIVCHPAVASEELDQLCSDNMPGRKPWAKEIRVSDLECLLDAGVGAAVRSKTGPA